MADFEVQKFGSVWSIQAVSDNAKLFAKDNFAVEDWQGLPDCFYADWRPARDLCLQLSEDGFDLAVRGSVFA